MSKKLTVSQLAEIARKSKNIDVANLDSTMLDLDKLTSEEVVHFATMSRLHRLADKNYDGILNDHLYNFSTVVNADRMVDVLTPEYIMELPLSYNALSQFMSAMKAAATKHHIQVPDFWQDMIDGQFDYMAELNEPE